MTVCALMTLPHTEQWLPAVLPSVVQVAATALSVTTVCPLALMTVCALMTLLHTEQWLPAVLPSVVQVAATALSVTSVWPLAFIVLFSTFLHTEQVRV